MGGKKTRNGVHISAIERALAEVPGVTLRDGAQHAIVAMADGFYPCAIATSSHCRRQIAPWVARVTSYSASVAYEMLRGGYWQ
jgi:hypothetical protein